MMREKADLNANRVSGDAVVLVFVFEGVRGLRAVHLLYRQELQRCPTCGQIVARCNRAQKSEASQSVLPPPTVPSMHQRFR